MLDNIRDDIFASMIETTLLYSLILYVHVRDTRALLSKHESSMRWDTILGVLFGKNDLSNSCVNVIEHIISSQ